MTGINKTRHGWASGLEDLVIVMLTECIGLFGISLSNIKELIWFNIVICITIELYIRAKAICNWITIRLIHKISLRQMSTVLINEAANSANTQRL